MLLLFAQLTEALCAGGSIADNASHSYKTRALQIAGHFATEIHEMPHPLLALLLVASASAFSTLDKEFGSVPELHVRADTWFIVAGDVCQLGQLPRAMPNASQFLQCTQHSDLGRADLGVWLIQLCPPGLVFAQIDAACRPERQVRRQVQSLCGANPTACGAPQFQVQVQQQAQPCPCQAQPQASCMCPGPQVDS